MAIIPPLSLRHSQGSLSMDHRAKRALITGITGQDGSYLAELLLSKDYEVHGIVRHASRTMGEREYLGVLPPEAAKRVHLHPGDLTDGSSIQAVVRSVQPDEVYNLAAQSHVRVSFDLPEY